MPTTQCEKDSLNQWNSQLNTETTIQNTSKGLPWWLVVKTLPSNAGDMGLIPSWELRSHMPHGQKNKTLKTHTHTQKQITNSIKSLKWSIHINKNLKKKKTHN